MKSLKSAIPPLARCLLPAVALLLGACATEPEPDNLVFGESVRHMIALQTADPDAGARGLDGERAEAALRAYRQDVGKPETVQRAVLLEF